MTVSTSTAKAGPYAGAGSVGPFTVPFRFLDASHLQVIRTATNGVDSVLVLTTDYTVSGVGLASGSVTLTTALAFGEKLTVIRSVPFTQEADYVNNDAFPAESHETALDKLTMQTQQLKERVDAALTLPATAAGVSTTLPAPVAGNVIGWDQGGTGLQNYTLPELVSTAVYADWKYKTFVGNGSTVSYVLDTAPGNIANLDVSFDGVTQVPMADFTLSGNVVTFTSAPPNGVNILFRYGSSVAEQTTGFTVEDKIATASQTVFTLGNVYVPGANNLAVYVNGLRLSAGDDYIETNGTTVTFTSGLAAGDEVTFVTGREISGATGAENVSFLQAGTGAVARDVQAKLRDEVSVKDFGAVGDGTTNDTAAIQAAIATGRPVYFPKPSSFYLVTSAVTITVPFLAGLYQVFGTNGNIKFGLGSVTEVYPEWFGAKAEADTGAFDSTAAIQAAISSTATLNASTAFNEGTTLRVPVKFSMGVYYTNNLTVPHPIRLIGSGMKNTMVKSVNTNTNLVTITAVEPVEIYDLSFGVKDGLGPMTGGSFLLFDPVSFSNQYSKIARVAFNNCFDAIRCVDSMFMIIDSCYFNRYSNRAITIANGLLPDGGDSSITNCTFNNGTGTAIFQANSGGLRITNNKFLGGNYSYYGEYAGGFASRTGQLIISHNSFDQCTVANIAFARLTDSVFSSVVIENNIIVASPSCYAILVNAYAAATYLFHLTIGGNLFYLRNNATGIHLASCNFVSIHPNHFYTDGGDTATGIIFSNGGPIDNVLVHPQSFMGTTTLFSGSQTNISFIAGKNRTFAGNPNNNITPNYIGEECLDTTNSRWYKSFGLAGNQWAALN